MCTCLRPITVKAVNACAPKTAFVPCNTCDECRKALQNQWAFRLRAELEAVKSEGWNIGFFTLTYNDDCLPHFPESAFKIGSYIPNVQCFNRDDVRNFIDTVRKWLHYHYKAVSCKYLIASEYGDNTRRSHYHGIIATPPNVPPEMLFNKIHSTWKKLGFVFPRNFYGGVDSHGYEHKPFLLDGDVAGCARYASKYVCKDLAFADVTALCEFNKYSTSYKRCKQFHIQSRSLGLSLLYKHGYTDEQKMNLLKRGYAFLGSDTYAPIPVYIRNKIVFDNVYQYERTYTKDDSGQVVEGVKRLVRKRSNDFFKRNYKQIFDAKLNYYEKLFSDALHLQNYDKDLEPDVAQKIRLDYMEFLRREKFSVRKFAQWYLAYYGCPSDVCLDCGSPALSWLNRYDSAEMPVKGSAKVINSFTKDVFESVCAQVLHGLALIPKPRSVESQYNDLMSDYFHHLV